MLFVILSAIFIAFSYEPRADRTAATAPVLATVAVLCMVGTVWLLAELFARFTTWRLQRHFYSRGPVMRMDEYLRWVNTAWLLASYTWLIHGLDWPAVVWYSWGLERWVLIDELLILSPFLVSLVLAWLARFRVEDHLRTRAVLLPAPGLRQWSRWGHVELLMRHHLGLVLVPLMLLVAVDDVAGLLIGDSLWRQNVKLVAGVVGFGMLIVFAPMLLRLLWRARPLPAGSLRQRLDRLSRRLGFRSSDILVWETHGMVINAAVAGILPWLRFVLVSDGLLRYMTEDEVEAVFGHEVGHIRHRHLWFYVAFLLGAMLLLMVALGTMSMVVSELLGQSTAHRVVSLAHGLVLPLACVAAYFGIFFGFLSRRFERQADVFGCRVVSCGRGDCPPHEPPGEATPYGDALCPVGIRTFVGALEKISLLNGTTRDTRSWRHFSIAKRVEFLERLAVRPELEHQFQRVVWLLKLLVLVALAGSCWWAWHQSPELAGQLFGSIR